MRNVPTIISMLLSEKGNVCYKDTQSTHYESPVTHVNNGECICLITGLCQIFKIIH